jgi:hypothetical protein
VTPTPKGPWDVVLTAVAFYTLGEKMRQAKNPPAP